MHRMTSSCPGKLIRFRELALAANLRPRCETIRAALSSQRAQAVVGVQKPPCDRRGRASKQSAPFPIPLHTKTINLHHLSSRSRAHTTLSPSSALSRTVSTPRAILRGGLTSAVTPGPVWSSSSCFVTAAVVSPSSDEELLGIRLL